MSGTQLRYSMIRAGSRSDCNMTGIAALTCGSRATTRGRRCSCSEGVRILTSNSYFTASAPAAFSFTFNTGRSIVRNVFQRAITRAALA